MDLMRMDGIEKGMRRKELREEWKERIKWREEWKRNKGRVAEKSRKGNT